MKPQRSRTVPIFRPVQRSSDAELDRSRRVDQALLDRAATPGAMRIALTPVAVPGIGVRVEVDQADRAVAPGDRPQLAQRDRVVTADGQWNDAGLQDRAKSIDHDLVTDLDVARDD